MIYISHKDNGQPIEASDKLTSITTEGLSVTQVEGSISELPSFYKLLDGEVVDLGYPPSPSFSFNYSLNTWADQRGDVEKRESYVIQFRLDRNALLAASDWTQVADAPVDQAAWAAYRQALRDITAQAGFPKSIDWPLSP